MAASSEPSIISVAARWLSLALLCCLTGCSGGQGSAKSHSPSEGAWVLVSTEHFRIYSDVDGDEIRDLAVDLERDLRLIAQAAFRTPTLAVEPTDVVIFSQEAHFYRYFPKWSAGVFYPSLPLLPETGHTVVTFEGLSDRMRTTLRHELVHDVYARNFGAAPPWLNEGFAQYFSTVALVDGEIHIGAALPGLAMTREFHPFATRQNGQVYLAIPYGMIPAPSELLKMSAQDFYGEDDESADGDDWHPDKTARYLGAWAFVHFLMDTSGDYSGRFERFLSVVRTTSVSDAWAEAFAGVSTGRLDEDFGAYLRDGRLGMAAVRYQPPAAKSSPRISLLGQGEKHVLLARLALAVSSTPLEKQAFLNELEAALRSQPPPPEAYYLRGMFVWHHGGDAEASRDFEHGLVLAPNDPRLLRASLALRMDGHDGPVSGQELTELRVAVERLERLATLPLDLLFVAQFFAAVGEKERALALTVRAVNLSPVDPLVLGESALVLESCGHLEKAIAMQRRAVAFLYEHRQLQARFRSELERMESQAAGLAPGAEAGGLQ